MSILNVIFKELRSFANGVDPRHGTKTVYTSGTTGKVILSIESDVERNWEKYGFSSRGNVIDYLDWARTQLRGVQQEKEFRAPNGMEGLLQRYSLDQYRQQSETL